MCGQHGFTREVTVKYTGALRARWGGGGDWRVWMGTRKEAKDPHKLLSWHQHLLKPN